MKTKNSSSTKATRKSSRKFSAEISKQLLSSFSPASLPSVAAIALQVVHAAGRRNCTPSEIVDLISQDPALSAKLLKAVNSCVYGLANPVTSIVEAVHILGLNPLRSLVLGLALPAFQVQQKVDQHTRDYWISSVSGGIFARELSLRKGTGFPDDALVVGLLRNVGQVFLRQRYPEQINEIDKNPAGRTPDQIIAAERFVFGYDHAELSALILQKWNLPAEIVEPIRYHHQPERSNGQSDLITDRAHLLYLVEHLVHLDLVAEDPVQLNRVLNMAQVQFGMTQKELIRFLESVAPKVAEFASLLEVDITQYPDYSRILTTGAETLIGLTVEVNRSMLNNANMANLANTKESIQLGETRHADTPLQIHTANNSDVDSEAFSLAFNSNTTANDLITKLAEHPRYHIIEQIGRGGMGTVFRAEHRMMGRIVALKVVSANWVGDARTAERFRREVRFAAKLVHPNIVTAYDADEIGGCQCLVMEFVKGMSLDRLITKDGPLSVAFASQIIRHAAMGLQYANEQGMVHRDIKPHNIILASDGQVKILDFGLARLTTSESDSKIPDGMTGSEHMVGTPDFIAPEQAINSTDVDHRTDLYSLGCAFFFLLTGQPPFNSGSSFNRMAAHQMNTPPRLSEFRNDVPNELQIILDKMMEKKPANRYQSANEFIADLDTLGSPKESLPATLPVIVIEPAKQDSKPLLKTTPKPNRNVTIAVASGFGFAIVIIILLICLM